MSWSTVHSFAVVAALLGVGFATVTGWTPDSGAHGQLPASVRANPASYRPVYVVYVGGSGGWGSGK